MGQLLLEVDPLLTQDFQPVLRLAEQVFHIGVDVDETFVDLVLQIAGQRVHRFGGERQLMHPAGVVLHFGFDAFNFNSDESDSIQFQNFMLIQIC